MRSVISGGVYVGNDPSHKILADNAGSPETHSMVFCERRNSERSEHPGLHGCERSAACDNDIEDEISCSLSQKSGEASFSTVSSPSCVIRNFLL